MIFVILRSDRGLTMGFKPGDVVYLKSGGERMTVQSVDATGVICIWHDKARKLQTEKFPEVVLEGAGDGIMMTVLG